MIEVQTLHQGSSRQRQVCLFNKWFAHFYLLVTEFGFNHEYDAVPVLAGWSLGIVCS
jgi:hypothetical protein